MDFVKTAAPLVWSAIWTSRLTSLRFTVTWPLGAFALLKLHLLFPEVLRTVSNVA